MGTYHRLDETVGIESLMGEICRSLEVLEVHVRAHTDWTWTRHVPDDEDGGIRYGTGVALTVVTTADPGLEVEVAHLLLEPGERGDLIRSIDIDTTRPYHVVRMVCGALGVWP